MFKMLTILRMLKIFRLFMMFMMLNMLFRNLCGRFDQMMTVCSLTAGADQPGGPDPGLCGLLGEPHGPPQ